MNAEDIKSDINKIETSKGCNINSIKLTSDLGVKVIKNLIESQLKGMRENMDFIYKKATDLEAENKKLKESSSILNSLSEEKPCPACNNKLDYKPRIYHCNHCGSDFN